jgi:hypothetical protein
LAALRWIVFAIIVLAGTDSDGRFNCATAHHSGTANEITVCEDSVLYMSIIQCLFDPNLTMDYICLQHACWINVMAMI